MLHDVGDVHLRSVYAGCFEGVVQQPAGESDKRPARKILLVARLFTDNENLRPFWTLTEGGLSP